MTFVGTCSLGYDSYLYNQKIELKSARILSHQKANDFSNNPNESKKTQLESANQFTLSNNTPTNIDSNSNSMSDFGFIKPNSNSNETIMLKDTKPNSNDEEDDELYSN